MLEQAPEIVWPAVREGKTEGYMIVYARTDRTGQVRETAKHNSDQPGLEDFGMVEALHYKFKPLLVDGVAMQMEMPRVLHFTSTLTDPIPILSAEEMKKQTISCAPPRLTANPAGDPSVSVQVSVDENGKVTGAAPIGKGVGTEWLQAMTGVRDCHFKPLLLNGKKTYYKGTIVVSR